MKKGLGKGLGALIANEDNEPTGITEVKINEIEPNINQPRKRFDDEHLKTLSDSIRQHGVVQPIIVRNEGEGYKIVAGERRWRAARLAGLETIPVIIKELENKQVMEIALIENIQRQDLNPIEEAEAYERLLNEYEMTQEEISNTVGKSRSAVANSLRLLNLNEKIKSHVINEELSSGHARALMSIDNEELINKAADEVIERNLNVRETEALVKKYLSKKKTAIKKGKSAEIVEIEDYLKNVLGTKVQLMASNKKGKIMIEYYSNDELERIIELVKSIPKNTTL
ncbi:MAG TPA: ParB/RepB/Spo0J family partition protein [Clostridia bacterium]